MKLTDKQLEDFKSLYKKHFNIELSNEDALEKGISLVTLFKHVLLPNIEKGKK